MRVLVGSVLVAGALLFLAPASATADAPVDLEGERVVDTAGVLTAQDVSRIEAALDRLASDRGTPLSVVVVDTFDGTGTDQDWANDSAVASDMDAADVLLAIAVDETTATYSVDETFALSDDQLNDLITGEVIPLVRDGEIADAAVAFADGVNAAQAPSPVPWIIGGVVLGGAAVAGAATAIRRRSARKREEAAARAEVEDLDRKAGVALVDLDDALRTSEQELGFAQAQFGEEQTREFEAALAEAKATAKQAFEIRQQLDDAFPESPAEHRELTLRLIDLAAQADATLDAQADAFEALRELEQNAPKVLDQVESAHESLGARVDAAEARIATLAAEHPGADLTTVTGVPAQARKLLAFAATAIADARAELAAPDGAPAVAVRGAQQAVGQVEQLLASVETLAAHLAERAALGRRAAAEAERVLQDATAAVSSAQDYITANRGAVFATARTRMSEAERHLAAASAAGATAETVVTEAGEAERLARQAIAAARGDVADYEEQSAVREWGRSDPADLERRRYEEADGASLGGILADLFFGGGQDEDDDDGGGWFWGGGGSSGGGWSSSRPSGFGGSSRRSSSSSRRSSFSSRRSSGSSSRRSSGGRSSGRRR